MVLALLCLGNRQRDLRPIAGGLPLGLSRLKIIFSGSNDSFEPLK
jgi:hypothetical protein